MESPSMRRVQASMAGSKKFLVLEDENSQPPKNIFEAAERGVTQYITRQVERTLDFDINQRDKFNRTALHWAAEMGHHATAEALLDFNIDIGAAECNGRTAFHLAARCCDAEMLRTMLETVDDMNRKRTLVNQTDHFGITPVFLTLQKGEEGKDAFQLLMANGARFNDLTASALVPPILPAAPADVAVRAV